MFCLTLKAAGWWELRVAQPVHTENLAIWLTVIREHTGTEVIPWADGPTARVL